jgi:hypothetical protein
MLPTEREIDNIVKKALIPIEVAYTHMQTYTHLRIQVRLLACTLHYKGRIGYLLKPVSVFMVAI